MDKESQREGDEIRGSFVGTRVIRDASGNPIALDIVFEVEGRRYASRIEPELSPGVVLTPEALEMMANRSVFTVPLQIPMTDEMIADWEGFYEHWRDNRS